MSDLTSPINDADERLHRFCVDMHLRLLSGEPVTAEMYFDANRWLSDDSARAVKLILTEYTLRRQLGQPVEPDSWLSRFPRWADDLRRCFDLLRRPPAGVEESGGGTVPLAPTGAAPDGLQPLPAHQLIELIGEGGMGRVYLARDAVLGRTVALKQLHPALSAPGHLARFCREARAAACLRHPNIVPILAIGLFEGQAAYTMPLLSGGSLTRQMPRLRNDPRQAAALLARVARAVHHAHQHGIVHRDLKPSNILLDEKGEPLVADFGLARFIHEADELTQSGQMLGTPAYMSPEQVAGKGRPVAPACDVWSLGVILYQAVVGHRPFQSTSSHELLRLITEAEPTPPRRLHPELPAALEVIILRCLEKEPADRYASAAALADDLERYLRGDMTEARPPAAWRRWERALRTWRPTAPVALLVLALPLLPLLVATGPRPAPAGEGRPSSEAAQRRAAVDAISRDLRRSRAVTLVGRTGGPRAYRWVTEPDRAPLRSSANHSMDLSSWTTSLVELMPTAGCDVYEYSARMRYRQGLGGNYGLYCLHEESTPRGQPGHACFVVSFREGMHWLELVDACFMRYHDESPAGLTKTTWLKASPRVHPLCWLAGTTVGLGGGPVGPLLAAQALVTSSLRARCWREVKVTVDPARTVVRLDGWPIGGFTWNEQIRTTIRTTWAKAIGLDPRRAPPPPSFSPRGGLGLFVRSQSAEFGPVRLRMLPNP